MILLGLPPQGRLTAGPIPIHARPCPAPLASSWDTRSTQRKSPRRRMGRDEPHQGRGSPALHRHPKHGAPYEVADDGERHPPGGRPGRLRRPSPRPTPASSESGDALAGRWNVGLPTASKEPLGTGGG